MKVLALDCSTQWCSVALLHQSAGHNDIIERSLQASRKHTQHLLPMVDQVLADAQTGINQIDAIAFGCGPGSFTGLRICLGAVQGLAFGADLPVVPVSSLKAQAHQLLEQARLQGEVGVEEHHLEWVCRQGDIILSTLDARMDEVYWATYQVAEDKLISLGNERLTSPERLEIERLQPLAIEAQVGATNNRQLLVLGSGYSYRQRMPAMVHEAQWLPQIYPSARSIAQLARFDVERGATLAAEQAAPVYLRDEVAWQKQPPVAL